MGQTVEAIRAARYMLDTIPHTDLENYFAGAFYKSTSMRNAPGGLLF